MLTFCHSMVSASVFAFRLLSLPFRWTQFIFCMICSSATFAKKILRKKLNNMAIFWDKKQKLKKVESNKIFSSSSLSASPLRASKRISFLFLLIGKIIIEHKIKVANRKLSVLFLIWFFFLLFVYKIYEEELNNTPHINIYIENAYFEQKQIFH